MPSHFGRLLNPMVEHQHQLFITALTAGPMCALSINIHNHNNQAYALVALHTHILIDIQYVFDHIIAGGCVYICIYTYVCTYLNQSR